MRSQVDIVVSVGQSLIGPLTVAESKRGVLLIHFGQLADGALREQLVERTASDCQALHVEKARGSATLNILVDYIAGQRSDLPLTLDWGKLTPFQKRVLSTLRKVRRGSTVTYGELADRVGSPKGARAVGMVMRTNPLPIVVPCHRVLSKGGIGGFSGGLDIKRRLLSIEGVEVRS